jgi:hypothetical protein
MDGESDGVNRATERAGCERRSGLAGHGARPTCAEPPAQTSPDDAVRPS